MYTLARVQEMCIVSVRTIHLFRMRAATAIEWFCANDGRRCDESNVARDSTDRS